MTSLELQCRDTARIVMASILEDDNWRAFGFSARPRRGRLFMWLVSKRQLARETALLQEMYSASFGRVFCWACTKPEGWHRIDFMSRLMSLCVDGELWKALRFTSKQAAYKHLLEACYDYGSSDIDGHAALFLQRCGGRIAGNLPTEWLVGSAYLFSHPNSMMTVTAPALDASGTGENYNDDLPEPDSATRSSLTELFTETATVTEHAEQCCRAGKWIPGNQLSEVVRTLGLTTRDFELLYHHLRGKGIKIPLVRGAMLNPDVVEYFFTHIGRDGVCDPGTTSRLALLVDQSTPFSVTWRQPFSELEQWPPPHAPRHFRPTIARRMGHYG